MSMVVTHVWTVAVVPLVAAPAAMMTSSAALVVMMTVPVAMMASAAAPDEIELDLKDKTSQKFFRRVLNSEDEEQKGNQAS